MADDSPKSVVNGFLGHRPPWPRKALNNSVIGMEQAYRQRKGRPLLTDADMEALKAGQPMLWESGDAASAPASVGSPPTPAPAATAAAPVSPASAAATSAPSAGISEEVAKRVVAGNKWSKSTIAAEQARRGRKGLPALSGAEITALLGEPASPVATAPVAATAASAPRPAAAAVTVTASAASTQRRTDQICRHTGGGDFQSSGPRRSSLCRSGRQLRSINNAGDWCGVPLPLFWPRGSLHSSASFCHAPYSTATSFKIGYPEEYGLGVDTKWQQKYRIWVDRTPDRLFVIYVRCTHLGWTPDWKPRENKFKCPCPRQWLRQRRGQL